MAKPGPGFSETPWGASLAMTPTRLDGFPDSWPCCRDAGSDPGGSGGHDRGAAQELTAVDPLQRRFHGCSSLVATGGGMIPRRWEAPGGWCNGAGLWRRRAYWDGASNSAHMRRQRGTVAWGGVSLEKQCFPERVLPIRRIRGWVGAEPDDPGLTPGATLIRCYAAL